MRAASTVSGSWLLVVPIVLGLAGSDARADALYHVTSLGDRYPIGINNQGEVGLADATVRMGGGFGTWSRYLHYPRTAEVYESLGPNGGALIAPSSIPGDGKGSTSPWINDAGDRTGVDDQWNAFVSIGGARSAIPTYSRGVLNEPRAINRAGQVVGEAFFHPEDDGYHAFLYSDGVKQDLGTLGGRVSQAAAINDRGMVVGWANLASDRPNYDGPIHAFLDDGRMRDLGPALGGGVSHAYGINSAGDIVGDRSDSFYGPYTAFLLKDGQATDLNDLLPAGSPWHLQVGLAINDLGQILGVGTRQIGGTEFPETFLLTPAGLGSPPDPLPVPEPGPLALLGVVSIGFVVRRVRFARRSRGGPDDLDRSRRSGRRRPVM
ncbi:MAG TPA: PEP-CTERM sorting domain-containing protein [Isosphaeraceae bacterium]|jgi:probable HAF family extracellular repeat protein